MRMLNELMILDYVIQRVGDIKAGDATPGELLTELNMAVRAIEGADGLMGTEMCRAMFGTTEVKAE